ncbi:hypothetical protein [Flavobacterium sp. N1719]|uniref:hypothetical protein n=1 Tax=Flavobacterium sp. N1719 TaxID=2885633 RepID=UPI002222125D|nr:hypothetical protein [Flavobacterium sp. N1719]
MKKRISQLLLLSALFCADVSLFAQGGPGGTGDGGLEGGDPAPAPINTNLFILTIVAVIFAGYKMRNYRLSLK